MQHQDFPPRGRRVSRVAVPAAVWRPLTAWANRTVDDGTMTTVVIAVKLLLGTILCFGLRPALRSYRMWLLHRTEVLHEFC